MQNTANTATAHQAQVSSSVSSQLDNITEIRNTSFNGLNEDLRKSFYNQNLMQDTMETCYLASGQRFASIEEQLARLGMNPQAPIVQSLPSCSIQYQAVLLQEQGGTAAGPPPPPVPPPSRHVYNITASPLPQLQQYCQPEMVAGKAPPLSKFRGNMKDLNEWIH